MNLQFYREKLENSKEYKDFMKKNPKAFFCSGYFSIDKEGKEENQVHFDFFIPKTKEIFSFKLNDKIEIVSIKNYGEKDLEEVHSSLDFDLEEFEKIILKKMDNEKLKHKAKKFLFSLQCVEEKSFLIATVFLSNLALLKVNLSLPKGEIVSFEKKSFMDMFKVIKKK